MLASLVKLWVLIMWSESIAVFDPYNNILGRTENVGFWAKLKAWLFGGCTGAER